ncbi:iron-containing alcohol dehydrogenase [Devosia salina]|uniref:Iron-containing alcohol dehydrogenase n=1 Tax=Devosia salina TaxID=2860336 RepID=A0ABX8WCC1_9HYPH|nr:iron-containing alcohol dehydrogenase [Devosia salina]QYO75204.1 iron-containing alcohol dehydrogenase [Devosia salina]
MFGVNRSPRNVVFGEGQRASIGRFAAQLGRRALVVTDARMENLPEFKAILDQLDAVGLKHATYCGVEAELPAASLDGGVVVGQALDADVVLGIGGGSCLDAAKVIALLLSHGGRPSDYYGEFKVPGPTLPVIAVPTTSGTGSEATPVAVVSDKDRALKVGIASPHLVPHTAICDPELTYTCPPALTAIAGADALVHAIEAFTTKPRTTDGALVHDHVFLGKNVTSDLYALEAVRRIGVGLARACSHPDDVQARADVMLGSLLAGQAFGVAGTSICHAAQYPIGARTHTPHGLGVAAMLPYALEFNRHHAGREIAQIGMALGAVGTDVAEQEAVEVTIVFIENLLANIGVPPNLEALGLAATDLDWTAENAMSANRLIKNNPRTIELSDMAALLRAAHAGDRMQLRQTEHRETAS